MTKPLAKNSLYGAIGLAAFLVANFLIHSLLPPAVPKGIAAKLEFFAQHKDEFDTLIVGTSRVYYSIAPQLFDQTTRENGLPTRTFNFGIDGMHPPENFYVLEQILKTKPQKLKWVVLEMAEIQVKWDNVLGTQRVVYWHDWPRTELTLKKALNPRGNANWLGTAARLWLARRELILNLALFGKQFASVGRASDFSLAEQRERFREADSELGPNRDGYRPAGDAMSAERAAIFREKLAQEVSDARPKFLDPATDQAYREAASQICQAGAAPVFVVAPIITQTVARFRRTPPAPLLSFNDSRKYPQFYDTNVRIDDAHLTREGAAEFTRLLAREFVHEMRQP
ncbi:MAG TPA: hypothetical protein VLO30_10435 [Chthoniobacterales bacterium]|nr:hypothetical protein [Chthoniobacterales bacterium]